MNHHNLITILGPTASGKTTFAAHLAKAINSEIISADSRQIYRGMDIGTGKDLDDYTIENSAIPYHLIDIANAGEQYNVFRYQQDFEIAYKTITSRDILPIMCGGTGMYIEAILKGYKLIQVPPDANLRAKLDGKTLDELKAILASYKMLHNNTDSDTLRRAIRGIEIEEYYRANPEIETTFPQIKSLIIGINIDRDARREKITKRLKSRIEEGMVDEVKKLLAQGVTPEQLIYYGLEYKFLTLFVLGKLTFEEMFSQLEIAIHQFAKRQMTWFRGMERRGFSINWMDASLPTEAKIEKTLTLLEKNR